MAEAKFEDIWRMEDLDEDYIWSLDYEHDVNHKGLADIINASEYSYGDDMKAYLLFMAPRLVEMRRILKPTGSIYYHCDPTASHYIKAIMDCIFGANNFRNEIVWRRHAHSHSLGSKQWPVVHDIIFMYSIGKTWTWNQQYEPYSDEYIYKSFRYKDHRGSYQAYPITGAKDGGAESYLPWRGVEPSAGRAWALPRHSLLPTVDGLPSECTWRELSIHQKLDILDDLELLHWPNKKNGKPSMRRYLSDAPGKIMEDLWIDIGVSVNSKQRTGYPTQKPLELLERIIKASSNIDDIVFDPFAGSATTLVQAEIENRQWFGCDISNVSDLITDRLKNTNPIFFGDNPVKSIRTTAIQRADGSETKAEKAPTIREHIRDLYKKQDKMCANCSMEINLSSRLVDDVERLLKHFKPSFIRPLNQGGTLDISNRKLICIGCYYES